MRATVVNGSRSVGQVVAGLLLFATAFCLLSLPASGEDAGTLRGVALVIGNGDYEHLPRLANPENDADAIEELLSDLGFDSVARTDRDVKSLARDLDRFVEDAAGADVAILYYAGHGIEAGGENFLVPVDADLAALDDATERLVPLSAILARLRETVPVTILLLDACRDNPFPPGATLRLTPASAALPVAAGGLAETRGARALDGPAPEANENLGMVIGFAAEPGRPALDGDGDNSPYAAALLRHVPAMAGEEFGTVMRMVAEEVYLDTGGRQRPWVNESLRRLLYLGEAPAPVEGAEGEILAERRQLLVRISALPDVQRGRAEDIARGGRVPMSVVYAMMQALDLDPGSDPTALEARLRAEVARFAESRQAREALVNPDPEIARLTRLADEAESEGALNAADDLREKAKARVAELRSTREEQIAALRERIVEDAEVFARSAETKKLLFRHADAARDYGEARAIVADWDAGRARAWLAREIDAWRTEAELRGSPEALATTERLAREALETASGMPPAETARLRHRLALALMVRASRDNDVAAVREALATLDAALADAGTLPQEEGARLLLDAGRASGQLALAGGDVAALENAEARFLEAASLARSAGAADIEAEARFRRVQALYFRWSAAPDPALFATMQSELAALAPMYDDEPDPLSARYAVRAPQIAFDLAMRMNTPQALSLATEMNAIASEMFDRERFPLVWAELAVNGGRIATEWAERFGDASQLYAALDAHDAAIAIFRDAGAATAALDTEWQRALTLSAIGLREPGPEQLQAAGEALARVAASPLAERNPGQMRIVRFQQARVAAALALRQGKVDALSRAIAGLETARAAFDPAGEVQLAVSATAELGKALYWRTLLDGSEDEDALRRAAGLIGEAVDSYRKWGADTANEVPFVELLKHQADATASLAIASHDPADIDHALAVGRDVYRRMVDVGHVEGVALTANTLAYVLVHALREDFDDDRLALAEEMAGTALSHAGDLPAYAGYFENTACEVKTEKARHRADRALAREALALCRKGAASLAGSGDGQAIGTAGHSVEAAEALVRELGD